MSFVPVLVESKKITKQRLESTAPAETGFPFLSGLAVYPLNNVDECKSNAVPGL